MAHIPIRALTLFKQGIGHFRRRGTLDERSLTGGPVQSVDYETPADKTQQLAAAQREAEVDYEELCVYSGA